MLSNWHECFIAAHKDCIVYKRFPAEEPIYIQRLNKDFTLGASLKIEMYDAKEPLVRASCTFYH